MKQNKHYSYNQKSICDGCKLCVKGRKSVIFITGLCPRSCEYCPLSDEKYKKDVMYCNERKVNKLDEIIAEVKISRSTGAGITGGDPLVKLGRTVEIIKMLKKSFGSKFHIHLYTSPNLVTEDKLNQLHKAGLDEIRFHPDMSHLNAKKPKTYLYQGMAALLYRIQRSNSWTRATSKRI